MLNWNDLRYFLAIARNGSIGTAAKALGVNESTVQRRLRALEAGLDCSLAERKSGGYQLTTQGQRLLEHARQVEASVGTLQRQVATFEPGITGHVRLTSPVTVGQRIIKSGFLDRFHLDHPGITVELIMEQRPLDLSKGEADIAIRGGGPGNSALVGKKIAEVPWGIYASHSFVERYGQPSTPVEIENFSVVELVDEIADLPATRWMKLNAPKARSAARCSNIPGVHLAIKAGAGIAPLPAVYAAADKDLVCVLGPVPELNYPMFLLSHKDLRTAPRVSAVFEFCLRELKSVLLRGEMRKRPI
jgi:DNA-binding transcriptional LysR family regulator